MGEEVLAAGVTGGAGVASSLINNLFNLHNQNKANKLNYQMFQEGNKFAHDEAQLAFDRQSQFAWDMFNAENEYNSPINVLKRLEEAGISPFDYFSNGNSPAASGADVGSAAAQPSVANAMRAPTMDLNVVGAADAFSKILGSLSDKKLKDAQAKETIELLDARLKELLSKSNLNDALANYQNFRKMAEEYKLPYEVQQMVADYYETLSQTDLNKSSTALHRAERRLTLTKNKALQEQLPFILANMREDLNVKRSQATLNRSTAALNSEELFRLQDTHDDFVRIQSLVAGHHAIDFQKAAKTLDDYVTQLHNARLISDEEYKQVQSKTKVLQHEADWDTFNRVLNVVERVNDGVNKWAPWAFSREQSEIYSSDVYNGDGELLKTTRSEKRSKY